MPKTTEPARPGRYTLIFPESYLRRARRFLQKHPEIVGQYGKTLELLELDPAHPSLRLHALHGRLRGLHSVSVNISYRVIIEFLVEGDRILLVNVGKHDREY